MKAISLWQPWATLLIHGEKGPETRGQAMPKTLIGETVAIHAAAHWTGEMMEMCLSEPFRSVLASILRENKSGHFYLDQVIREKLPLGKVLGTVRFAGSVPTTVFTEMLGPLGPADRLSQGGLLDGKPAPLSSQQLLFGNYKHGRFAWLHDKIKRFDTPVEAKGSQGIWTWIPPGPPALGRPEVFNLNGSQEIPDGTVLIDRKTSWGNPFRIDNGRTRAEACDQFEDYAIARLKAEPGWLDAIKGCHLACHCAPKRCHGDTLIRLANPEFFVPFVPRVIVTPDLMGAEVKDAPFFAGGMR